MFRQTKRQFISEQGFSLAEVLLAVVILTTGLLGIITLVIRVTNAGDETRDEIQARALVQEALEVVTNIRDTNALRCDVYDLTNISFCATAEVAVEAYGGDKETYYHEHVFWDSELSYFDSGLNFSGTPLAATAVPVRELVCNTGTAGAGEACTVGTSAAVCGTSDSCATWQWRLDFDFDGDLDHARTVVNENKYELGGDIVTVWTHSAVADSSRESPFRRLIEINEICLDDVTEYTEQVMLAGERCADQIPALRKVGISVVASVRWVDKRGQDKTISTEKRLYNWR